MLAEWNMKAFERNKHKLSYRKERRMGEKKTTHIWNSQKQGHTQWEPKERDRDNESSPEPKTHQVTAFIQTKACTHLFRGLAKNLCGVCSI